jgi:hypothetical protein
MATFASVHRVWEQNWGLIVAIDSSENADNPHRKHSAVPHQKLSERSKAMVSCKEALKQLQEAQQSQHSTRQTDTPMQLMQQYNPVEAAAFRQAAEGREERIPKGSINEGMRHRVKGFVEAADEEASKRVEVVLEACRGSHSDTNHEPQWRYLRLAMVEEVRKSTDNQYSQCFNNSRISQLYWWQRRAQETSAMAQQFGQAAADAMSELGTALSSQEWDHRIIFKAHDFELARMEAALDHFIPR